jgi:DNA polymerase-1
MPSPTLYLIDGSGYLFRAYHALPPLSNRAGEPTQAMFGTLNMVRAALRENPDYIAFVMDAGGRNFRHEQYAAYKAHRPPIPEDLARQIEPLVEIVERLGLPVLRIPGVEADDVIATLARRAAREGMQVVISTGDKDLAQLVAPGIRLVNTMSGNELDEVGVEAKFGVKPAQIPDFLALVGDKTDNVPGVEKCGEKTAAKWLAEYGTLENLIAHAEDIPGKLGENLRRAVAWLPLSKELVTLRDDLELGLGPRDLVRRPPDREALRPLFERFEFGTWLRELDAPPTPEAPPPKPQASPGRYRLVLDPASFAEMLEALQRAPLVSLDTETSSLDPMRASLVGLSFAVTTGEGWYLPLAHDYPGAPEQLPLTETLERLKPLLEDPARPKVGQHLKYDLHVLANHGLRLAGIAHDTMLESYVLDPARGRHDLDGLAERELAYRTIRYEEVAGKGARQIPFSQVPVETACDYAAEDADVALRLHQVLWPRLQAEPALRRIYEEIEIPLVPVLAAMERHGVLLDVDGLRAQGRELGKRLDALRGQAALLLGRPLNLDSPKQLAEVLYGELGLPVSRRTPTRQPSTDEEALAQLAEHHELPRIVLEYRQLAKLKSTYTDRLVELIHPRTGRVHTQFHQAVAGTGRLSSSDPNLQNIPVRTEEGRRIRRAFVAPPGFLLVSADYSQIELRIMAHLSRDEGLLAAFREGQDVHRATAAEVFAVPLAEVSPEQRRAAKAINFGLIYGMSAFGLSRQLGIPRDQAEHYIARYFERYPGVRHYMEETRRQAHARGYVETLFGRRLYLPDLRARNLQRRQAAERAAINAPMQGSAADIIKRAMIAIVRGCVLKDARAAMILQVHDELVFEVPEALARDFAEAVRREMAGAAELSVPLLVEVGIGPNWDAAH